MINNNPKLEEQDIEINLLYIKNRKNFLHIIRMINIALDNTSQTFFLALYYMDLIFSSKNNEKIFKLFYEERDDDLEADISTKDLFMISLTCLIIATKYNENDPHVPNIISFIKLCSQYSYNKYNYDVNDISKVEVILTQFLKYKLNYFTIYHYFCFFFAHGFLFQKFFKNERTKDNMNKNKMLEKIYIESREIMDKFVEDNENLIYILGKNVYFTSIQILMCSVRHILNAEDLLLEPFKEQKNIFELIYGIKYDENKLLNEVLKVKIQKIYDNLNKKNETENQDKNICGIREYLSNDNDIKPKKNHNIHISSDKYYLEKYKNNDNYNINISKIENDDKKNAQNKLNKNIHKNATFYIPKNKCFVKLDKNKNKSMYKSNSTNNFIKYRQILHLKNNNINMHNKINFNKINNYSSQRKIEENKNDENEKEIKIKSQKNLLGNLRNRFNNNSYLSIFSKTNDVNQIKDNLSVYNEFNLNNNNNEDKNNIKTNDESAKELLNKYKNNKLNLNYKYDFRYSLDLQRSNNIYRNEKPEITNSKSYLYQKYNNDDYKMNNHQNCNCDEKRDMVYKTKKILENLNYNYSCNINNSNFDDSINNISSNFYNQPNDKFNSLTAKNKKNYLFNDRYNMKENFPPCCNNNTNNFTKFNQFKSFVKTKKHEKIINKFSYNINQISQNCRNGDNDQIKKFFPYGTHYQYCKLNKYENIDKFFNGNQYQEYLPIKLKSRNKYY